MQARVSHICHQREPGLSVYPLADKALMFKLKDKVAVFVDWRIAVLLTVRYQFPRAEPLRLAKQLWLEGYT